MGISPECEYSRGWGNNHPLTFCLKISAMLTLFHDTADNLSAIVWGLGGIAALAYVRQSVLKAMSDTVQVYKDSNERLTLEISELRTRITTLETESGLKSKQIAVCVRVIELQDRIAGAVVRHLVTMPAPAQVEINTRLRALAEYRVNATTELEETYAMREHLDTLLTRAAIAGPLPPTP